MNPEQQARTHIDKMLSDSGWVVQDMKQLDPSASLGVAVREYPTDTGPADYILLVDRMPVGVIEAKKEGTILSAVEEQTNRYATSGLKWLMEKRPLRFLYESTGAETHFTDIADPNPRAREVFSFHRPQTLKKWFEESDTLRKLLQQFPPLHKEGLRDCQFNAINNLEKSFAQNQPRALIQMATGAGKTFTAITSVYRLLASANAKRILFLVDTRNLGEQAEQEFHAFTPTDDNRKFKELYNVQRLNSSYIDPASQVCISTIQRMYSILKGEPLDESAEDVSLNEVKQVNVMKDVVYNENFPIETFDFIIIDECHRSIYNLWKQVLDYFDAFLIGLTATPDNRTFGFFNKNVVSEYSHEDAVADGVNVGYDVYTIETEITKNGAIINAKEWVDKRDRLSRRKTWEQLDEEVTYTNTQLDRNVVSPDQIRTVIRAVKEKLKTEIFPDRTEIPKTLIFAKTDSHAEDIIRIAREEFNEGNAFCKKVTYGNTEEKASEVLQQFRTQYDPRIAVTVDMIATGTDVKAIECLLFMRDVRSKSYFEQMKGRGTRVFQEDELRKVTPSAHGNKSHFVVIDAVGVCKSIKTDSRPLERNPGISLKNLMLNVIMGQRDEDTLTSLANRLTRLEKQITKEERNKLQQAGDDKTINEVVKDLLNAYNPDIIEQLKQETQNNLLGGAPDQQEKLFNEKRQKVLLNATKIFDKPEFRDLVENIRKNHDQIIDGVNIDTVLHTGWDAQAKEKASETIQGFKQYIADNKDTIVALQIFYAQPYRRRELTFSMIQDLCSVIKANKPTLAPFVVWNAYTQLEKVKNNQPKNELVALVSLIRRVLVIDGELTNYSETVNKNFQRWVFDKQKGSAQKFTEEQMEWLRMMKEHIANSIHIDRDDLENTPFAERGGLTKVWKLFGEKMDEILNELNQELAA